MEGTVEVLNAEDWAKFLSKEDERCKLDLKAPNYGEKLFAKYGCAGCHSVTEDRATVVGPGLYGLPGREESTSAGKVVADDDYLRESIVYASKKIVSGFEGKQMPSFEGRLSEQEIGALIDYIKGLDGHENDGGPTNDDKNE